MMIRSQLIKPHYNKINKVFLIKRRMIVKQLNKKIKKVFPFKPTIYNKSIPVFLKIVLRLVHQKIILIKMSLLIQTAKEIMMNQLRAQIYASIPNSNQNSINKLIYTLYSNLNLIHKEIKYLHNQLYWGRILKGSKTFYNRM